MHAMNILLIEEDDISREVLKLMLSDKFNLTVLDKLEDAEKAIFNNDYKIILLDIESSAYDGLKLCHTIAGDSLSSLPLVVALGEETAEEKLRAIFEAGAYDYFIKPYNVVLFHESLHRLVDTINAYQELEKSDQSARETISIALSQASYHGFAFDLLSEISRSDCSESLAETVLSGMSQRGVHCALQITSPDGQIRTFEEDKDVVGDRTLQVFSFVRDQGRIFRFGKRLVFNDDSVSLFIKSMDDRSENAYDCILDIGAKLIPSIENQLRVISEHQLLLELQIDVKSIIETLHSTLVQQADQAEKIIDSISGHISTSIDKLELTEVQEKFFMQMVETELQVEFKGAEIENMETAATLIYEKINLLQNKPKKETLHGSQFGEIDLF